ncbi:MAG: hypothetical protein LBJ69_00060 [Holosporales bacterium]|nr:hypothetical protein [Holosporales bacterium]
MNMQFRFRKFGSAEETLVNGALELQITEQEGATPVALVKYGAWEYERLKQFDICKITRGDTVFFDGQITSVSTYGDRADVTVSTLPPTGNTTNGPPSLPENIIDKFRRENPELFVALSSNEISRTGELRKASLLIPPWPSVHSIDSKIIDNSLKIKVSNDLPIGQINLEVSCSWISKRNGNVTLSSQIGNRFRLGKVNTLTPRKLEDSWPKFGDRLASNARSTKYFVGASKLVMDGSSQLPPITISHDIPKLTFKRYCFDNRLGIAWDYDQFMTEALAVTIINPLASEASKKTLRINLGNVQEYVDDNSSTSFLRSTNGAIILNEIQKSVSAYMALSMRNIEVSCDVVCSDDTVNLDCSNWISVRDIPCKITSIKHHISPAKHSIKITAKGFEHGLTSEGALNAIHLEMEENADSSTESIIQDIVVQNEGDVQYEKLLKYISEQKRLNKITKENYKRLISSFLNENQTKIQIILHPLKTQHCEKNVISMEPAHMEW